MSSSSSNKKSFRRRSFIKGIGFWLAGMSAFFRPIQAFANYFNLGAFWKKTTGPGPGPGPGPSGSGFLFAWGANEYGQAWHGDTTNLSSPTLAAAPHEGQSWVSLATRNNSLTVRNTAGKIYGAGNNEYGQLGNNSMATSQTTIVVATDQGVGAYKFNSAGGFATFGIQTDGTLWAWGRNESGNLGLGDTTNRSNPTKVGAANDWVMVNGGSNMHTVGLRGNDAYVWGSNASGKLGLNVSTAAFSTPQLLSTGEWRAVSAGANHTLGIKTNGTLWAWGKNTTGTLGDGTTVVRSSPVIVGADTDWWKICAGGQTSFGIKNNKELWAWGDNVNGKLGVGDTVNRSSPVRVGNALWNEVDAYAGVGCGIQTDGTLWAWGLGTSGALGQNNTTNQSSPVRIGSDGTQSWTAATAGTGAAGGLFGDNSP